MSHCWHENSCSSLHNFSNWLVLKYRPCKKVRPKLCRRATLSLDLISADFQTLFCVTYYKCPQPVRSFRVMKRQFDRNYLVGVNYQKWTDTLQPIRIHYSTTLWCKNQYTIYHTAISYEKHMTNIGLKAESMLGQLKIELECDCNKSRTDR